MDKPIVYTSTGQAISPLDPNYSAYASQHNPAPSSLIDVRNNVSGASGSATNAPEPIDPLAAGKEYAEGVYSNFASSMSVDDVRKREEDRKTRLAEQAESIFAPKIAEAEKLGEQRLGSVKGQMGITRGLGLSTAEISYINAIQNENIAAINDIKKQKEEYVANGNFKYAELAEEQIAKLTETQNNILLNKSKLALDYTDYLLEERKQTASEKASQASQDLASSKFEYDIYKDERDFNVGQDRFERTQAVQEGWLSRSLTEDDKKTAQDNIVKMANSGIDISEFSEEDITSLETRAGFVPGSFENIYNRATEQAKLGDTMDALKLQQLQNDVAKSFKALSGGGGKKETAEELSGKFSESYLATRANDFVNEDGSIDWGSVDELKDTDKDLWKDMTIILNNASQSAKAEQEKMAKQPVEQTKIEKDIEAEKKYGYTSAEIRVGLREKGYKPDEINNSSVGNKLTKIGNDIGNFFNNLFSD